MKKSPPSLSTILAVAMAVIAGGAFCFLFFPWPLWLVIWGLFSTVGLVQILAPTRADSRPQTSRPPNKGDFSGFDDKIKWDKFAALDQNYDQAHESSSWAKPRKKAAAPKKEQDSKGEPS